MKIAAARRSPRTAEGGREFGYAIGQDARNALARAEWRTGALGADGSATAAGTRTAGAAGPTAGTAAARWRPVHGECQADRDAIVDKAWVIRRAGELLALGNPRFARDIVRQALETFGRQADLLWILADTELANGDVIAGLACLDEALAVGPLDAASLARQIRILRGGGFWRQALSVVEAVPEDLCGDPLLQAELGNFYRACECPDMQWTAMGAAGIFPGHPARPGGGAGCAREARQRWLRQRALALEEVSLQDLRHSSGYIDSVSTVEGLDSRQVQRVCAKLETNRYRFHRRWYGWFAVHRLGYRLIPLAAIPVWLVLL